MRAVTHSLIKCMLVTAVASVSYLGSLWGDFVFDDSEAILSNKDIRTDSPLLNVFTNDFWGNSILDTNSHKSYRPLTVLTFRVNYWLGGMDPFGYHLANVILHALVSLLYLLVCACLFRDLFSSDTLKSSPSHESHWWSALLPALLFASHPVHTETVAGVVGRAELTSALCFFLTVLVYRHACLSSQANGSWLRVAILVILSIILAGCAMLFKEQGITVLGVCLVYDLLLMRVDPWQALSLQLPSHSKREWRLLIVRCSTVLLSGLLLGALRMTTGAPSFKPQDNPASFHNSTLTRVMSYNYLYTLNSWLLLCPYWLCFDWSMGCVPLLSSLADRRVLTVGLFWAYLLGLGLYCFLGRPSALKRLTTFALALLAVPFLPASNVLVRVGFVLAERVLYLPSAGFCLLVSVGATLLSKHLGKQVCAVLTLCVVLVFVTRSMNRTTDWLSEESLFTSGVPVCPHNAKVLYNVGKVRVDSGDSETGELAYREAIRLFPEYDQALNNYGNLLKVGQSSETGRHVEAEETLRSAVSVSPSFAAAWMNLGIVQAALNKTEDAETSYVTAIKHRNKYPDAYYNLGNLYIDSGRPSKAVSALKEAISLQRDHQNAWGNLALLYENLNMYDEAEKVLRGAMAAVPDSPQFYYSLGVVMGKMQRYKEGEELLLRALDMKPDSAKFHANIGVIYHFRKEYFLAKKHYRQALDLDPTMEIARDNLNKLMRANTEP